MARDACCLEICGRTECMCSLGGRPESPVSTRECAHTHEFLQCLHELLQVRGIGGRLALTIYKMWFSKRPMQLGSVRSFINNSLMSISQHCFLLVSKKMGWPGYLKEDSGRNLISCTCRFSRQYRLRHVTGFFWVRHWRNPTLLWNQYGYEALWLHLYFCCFKV